VYDAALLAAATAVAAAIARERSRPADVADLVVQLGSGSRSGTLRDALARALGDASLEVGFRVGDAYVDGAGRPLALAATGGGRDVRLDASVATAVGLTASNARLQAELRAQVAELAASRARLVRAGDVQRYRLEARLRQAADVHLEAMREALGRTRASAPADVAAMLDTLVGELEQAVADVHELARGIHPRVLTERGLAGALDDLAARAPTPVSVTAPPERYDPVVEAAAYFVCAEALANAGKHARATRTTVGVERSDGRLRLTVDDDGVGGADLAGGSGLRGLSDRLDAVGGRLNVMSPPGRGTRVVAELPLEAGA
jgi:signal transduction histidine kinase